MIHRMINDDEFINTVFKSINDDFVKNLFKIY